MLIPIGMNFLPRDLLNSRPILAQGRFNLNHFFSGCNINRDSWHIEGSILRNFLEVRIYNLGIGHQSLLLILQFLDLAYQLLAIVQVPLEFELIRIGFFQILQQILDLLIVAFFNNENERSLEECFVFTFARLHFSPEVASLCGKILIVKPKYLRATLVCFIILDDAWTFERE